MIVEKNLQRYVISQIIVHPFLPHLFIPRFGFIEIIDGNVVT
jgi:hypothetical protein